MLLSACLIVKNEALTLDRCLSSLHGVVDEIIVIDTGSTDDTVEIAKKHGAILSYFEWDGDFSHARNAALDLASGEYAMTIDADEYLDDRQKLKLREFLEKENPEALIIRQRNYTGELTSIKSVLPVNVVRIFRSYHRYEGSIHEQISYSVQRSNKPARYFDLDFHHVGYLREFMMQKGKSSRNRELLIQELKNDPKDLFHLSNLMAEYLIVGELEEVRKLGRRALGILNTKKEKPIFSSRIYSLYLLSLEDSVEAESYYREAIRLFPDHTDFYFRFAQFEIKHMKFQSAHAILNIALKLGDPKHSLIETAEGSGSFLAYGELSRVFSYMGDVQSATEAAMRSFFMQPYDSKVMSILSYQIPREGQDQLLKLICDIQSAGEWAVLQAMKGERVDLQIATFEKQFGKHVLFVFAKNVMNQDQNEFCEDTSEEQKEYLLGIIAVANGMDAKEHFNRGGAKGAFLNQSIKLLEGNTPFNCSLKHVVWDLIGFRAYELLSLLLPHCNDVVEIWPLLLHSPFEKYLSNVMWGGETPMELSHRAHRAFFNKDTVVGLEYVKRAEKNGMTIYSRIVLADLLLQNGDTNGAKKAILEAIDAFPQSGILVNLKRILYGETNHKQIFQALGGVQ